jgi:hypothetical protein
MKGPLGRVTALQAAEKSSGSKGTGFSPYIKGSTNNGLQPLRYAFLHSTRDGTENQAGQIASIHRYLVKSMAGEVVERSYLTRSTSTGTVGPDGGERRHERSLTGEAAKRLVDGVFSSMIGWPP